MSQERILRPLVFLHLWGGSHRTFVPTLYGPARRLRRRHLNPPCRLTLSAMNGSDIPMARHGTITNGMRM